jgi:hypothetical protein
MTPGNLVTREDPFASKMLDRLPSRHSVSYNSQGYQRLGTALATFNRVDEADRYLKQWRALKPDNRWSST